MLHKTGVVLSLLALGLILAPATGHVKEDPAMYPLVYGATEIQIGWIKIYNDFDAIHVEYEITAPGWSISETHLLVTLTPIVWTSSGDYPPGSYTYQHSFTPPYPTSDNYHITQIGHGQFGKDAPQISFSALSAGAKVYLIAHAAVIGPTGQQETAFGGGFRNADTVMVYVVQREGGQPPTIPVIPVVALPLGVVSVALLLRRSRR